MRKKIVTIFKSVRIHQNHQNMLDDLIVSGVHASENEIFRQALNDYYRKQNPPYLRPSVNEQIKAEELKKIQDMNATPDEEFARKHVKDPYFFVDMEGKKWLLFRRVGHYLGGIPIEMVKEWVTKKDPMFLWHQENFDLDTDSYESRLTSPLTIETLLVQHGLDVTKPDAT